MDAALLNAINARRLESSDEEFSNSEDKSQIVVSPDLEEERQSPASTNTRRSGRLSFLFRSTSAVPSADTTRPSSVDTSCSEESFTSQRTHPYVNVVLDTPDVGAARTEQGADTMQTKGIETILHCLKTGIPLVSSQRTQKELHNVAAREDRKAAAFEKKKSQTPGQFHTTMKKQMKSKHQKDTKNAICAFRTEQKQACFDEVNNKQLTHDGVLQETTDRKRPKQLKRNDLKDEKRRCKLKEQCILHSVEVDHDEKIVQEFQQQQQQAWDSCNEKIDNLPKDLYKAIIKTGMDDARKRALGLNEAKKFGAVPKLCKEFFRHEKGGRIGQPSLVPGTCGQVRVCRPICATRVSLLDQARMSCCGSDSCMWMRPCATLPLAILQQSLCMMLRPVGVRG
eukprot:m.918830 g.918830  ORF g.918830 m.918830 type:complete len:396 (+) comp23747_c0_seq7:186-1373(+)